MRYPGPASWFAAGAFVFIWLYRATLTFGWFDEDFSWLHWAATAKPSDIFAPGRYTYYRPAAVNLPYFLFTRFSGGIVAWSALALLIAVLAAATLALGRPTPAHRTAGAAAALFWLFGPFQSFPAFYVNAFDYILYPALALWLLFFLRREAFAPALFCFFVMVFTKEQAPAFFLAPFLFRRRPPRWYWVGSAGAVALLLFLHRGSSITGHTVGGFVLSTDPTAWLAQAMRLFKGLAVWSIHPTWGKIWHAVAWLSLAGVAGALALEGKRAPLLRLFAMFSFAVLIQVPLIFFPEVQTRLIGAGFWAVLLFALAEAAGELGPRNLARANMALALGAAVAIAVAAHFVPEFEEFYRGRSDYYEALLRTAEPYLRRCNGADRVVVALHDDTIHNYRDAKVVLWALRWRYLAPRFHLLREPGYPADDPTDPYLLVDRWQTAGHPFLTIDHTTGTEFRFQGTGDPGCGTPLGP